VGLYAQSTPQEKLLFEQLNQSRKEHGLPAFDWDERLADAARAHTQRMVDANELGHVLKGEPQVAERLAATGIRFNRSAENVGYNSDLNDMQHAWMDSPGHRENILNPNYNVVGIGVVRSDDGIWYATQDFAHALPQRTTAQAEDLAAESLADLRKKEGRLPLRRTQEPELEHMACEMAQAGKLDPARPLQIGGVREALVYNNSRPEELPHGAREIARNNHYTQFAVGACYTGDRPDNPGGTFYVVMAFY